MSKQEFSKNEYVKKTTFIVFSIVFLIVGFLGGVFFSRDIRTPVPQENIASQTQGDEYLFKILELKKWITNNPNDFEAFKQLGNLYFDSNQFEEAIKAYQKYLVQEPNNPSVLTDIGVMYRRAGNPNKAVESFNQAIKTDPKFETARFNKGIVFMHDLNDIDSAIKAWERLVEINPLALAPNGESVDSIVTRFKKELKKK